ncbi:MAG: hypothetical protein L0215_19070 [Gemmataceae bacterium]|nr:hypothetical protein [Gemmataceae bacterium]
MTQKRQTLIAMLLSFLAGALSVVGFVLLGQFSQDGHPLVPAAHANAAQPLPQPPTPPTPWLKGTADEKFTQIERHLRGLDVTMAEIGYRYGELLLAGKTRNWEYAQYQTEKIDFALRLAIERRPKRAKSSEPFLNESLSEVMKAAKAKDAEQFDAALERLHSGCVQCHKAENVLYFKESVDRIKERSK